jgi:hypothetical protein
MSMNRADFSRAVHECLPRRPTRTNSETGIRQSDEYGSAEIIAAELFRRDFEDRYSGAEVLFTAQHDYLSTRMTRSLGIEFLLNMMKEHFRNWASPRNPMRDGGFRKPDGMCIAARGHRVDAELLEVKPLGYESRGRTQMEDMLRRLREGLDESLKTQTSRSRFIDGDFSIVATEWRPRPDQMVCPLLNPKGAQELTWACFCEMGHRARVDGVLLYELHSISFRQCDRMLKSIPVDTGNRIRQTYENAHRSSSGVGHSWQHVYCLANPADLKMLRSLAQSSSWADLAAGLSLLLNQSQKTKASAASAGGSPRTLLESTSPLSVPVGSQTVVESAIEEAIVLANLLRSQTASN